MKSLPKPGQILILVLLVVVVTLAIGLSVASRNITNLRTATQTESSQRAFAAAEGGVEDVLSRLDSIRGDPKVGSSTGLDVPSKVGEIEANVNVKKVADLEQIVELGGVMQVKISGGDPEIKIAWGKKANPAELNPEASVEVTRYSQSSQDERKAFGELFDNGPSDCSQDGYQRCRKVSRGVNQILRLRPFVKGTTVLVSGVSSETYEIKSTATTPEGTTRSVKVVKNLDPQLPAVFDYVLFSEGGISKGD